MDKPKIALSAYQFNNPVIKELLNQCEFIFTTNVQARDALWAGYGKDVVRFLPDSTESTQKFIQSKFPNHDYVTFNDLFKLIN